MPEDWSAWATGERLARHIYELTTRSHDVGKSSNVGSDMESGHKQWAPRHRHRR
jgi:hypothetical protein